MPTPTFAQITTYAGLAILAVLLIGAAAFIYAIWQMMRLPSNTPEQFLERGRSSTGQRVAAIVGASIVHGRVSASFVDLTARKFPDWQFVNAGYNGDMVAHVLKRLGPVIACEPDAVVLLVGTNDVIGTLDTESWRRYRGEKRLFEPPSLDRYRETLGDVVGQLKQWTSARIGLCSLPALGEDLGSPANQRICEFNTAIEQVARQEGASYLPVFERETALLAEHQRRANSQGRPFTANFREYGQVMFLAAMRHYLLGASFDDVSHRNGLLLKTDLIHCNERDAGIIADEVEAFLRDAVQK